MSPRLTASKESIEGPPPMPEGLYTIRCDGFKPAFSKDRASKNLNPVLKVTNNSDFNDRVVFENLNTKGSWIWPDFCHAFGVPMVKDAQGGYEFPGDWGDFPEDKPELWQYIGPLLGQLAQVYLIQSEFQGKINNKIKFYVCKVQGCSDKHSSNLAK